MQATRYVAFPATEPKNGAKFEVGENEVPAKGRVGRAEQEQSSRDAAAGAREERGINRRGIKNGSNAQLRKGRGPLSLWA